MIYGISVSCQFSRKASVNTLLGALLESSGFFSLKGSTVNEVEVGIGQMYRNTPMLSDERMSPIPPLTCLDSPDITMERVEEGPTVSNLAIVLDGQVLLQTQAGNPAPRQYFFRERSDEELHRILQITVSVIPAGISAIFFSSSHIWLRNYLGNPFLKAADLNLAALARFAQQCCEAEKSHLDQVVFSRSLKGPFSDDMDWLEAHFAHLPCFTPG